MGKIESARLVIAADNMFECSLNGHFVSKGNRFQTAYRTEVAGRLQPGANLLTVMAVNTTDKSNPAGLVAALAIEYADGLTQEVLTDASWQVSQSGVEGWSAARGNSVRWECSRGVTCRKLKKRKALGICWKVPVFTAKMKINPHSF